MPGWAANFAYLQSEERSERSAAGPEAGREPQAAGVARQCGVPFPHRAGSRGRAGGGSRPALIHLDDERALVRPHGVQGEPAAVQRRPRRRGQARLLDLHHHDRASRDRPHHRHGHCHRRPVGPLALSLADGGHDALGHILPIDWKVTANLVFKISVHTTPLSYPALIQIPNDPGAWDQSGLQSANMVFESVAEGGITRFTAVFQQVPDKVGPVRSGRLISLKLTRHYRGRLFLSGTSQGTFGVLNSDPVPTFFDTQGFYYRTSDHRAPDNLYINADAIARAEAPGPAAFALPTGNPKLSGGQPANSISVPEHSTTFSLENDSKAYLKTEGGHQFGDASIGQPLRISMVIVMRTQVTTTGIIEDVNGAHGLDYNIDGSGSADVYYQGLKYGAHWSSPDRSSPLVFTTDAGQAIALPNGLVWIEVVPG
ncbi:MAG: DUF3048 domain-containing protein [Chloroflexi bacterium]|nr:MAG: DUF3048 domain-containing protein [Chloroflexota bacterium]